MPQDCRVGLLCGLDKPGDEPGAKCTSFLTRPVCDFGGERPRDIQVIISLLALIHSCSSLAAMGVDAADAGAGMSTQRASWIESPMQVDTKPTADIPTHANTQAAHLPAALFGCRSPYPIVVPAIRCLGF